MGGEAKLKGARRVYPIVAHQEDVPKEGVPSSTRNGPPYTKPLTPGGSSKVEKNIYTLPDRDRKGRAGKAPSALCFRRDVGRQKSPELIRAAAQMKEKVQGQPTNAIGG